MEDARATALGGRIGGEVAGAPKMARRRVCGEHRLLMRDTGGFHGGGHLIEAGGGNVDVAAPGDERLQHVLGIRRRRAEDDDGAFRGFLHRLQQ